MVSMRWRRPARLREPRPSPPAPLPHPLPRPSRTRLFSASPSPRQSPTPRAQQPRPSSPPPPALPSLSPPASFSPRSIRRSSVRSLETSLPCRISFCPALGSTPSPLPARLPTRRRDRSSPERSSVSGMSSLIRAGRCAPVPCRAPPIDRRYDLLVAAAAGRIGRAAAGAGRRLSRRSSPRWVCPPRLPFVRHHCPRILLDLPSPGISEASITGPRPKVPRSLLRKKLQLSCRPNDPASGSLRSAATRVPRQQGLRSRRRLWTGQNHLIGPSRRKDRALEAEAPVVTSPQGLRSLPQAGRRHCRRPPTIAAARAPGRRALRSRPQLTPLLRLRRQRLDRMTAAARAPGRPGLTSHLPG
mmetsp:Transcript_12519/g.36962  ORF Transcript_12519/g.36962 Transcript_12519/m.36962 type:complete len:358 (+) Transcript_12519:1951-3024(+)